MSRRIESLLSEDARSPVFENADLAAVLDVSVTLKKDKSDASSALCLLLIFKRDFRMHSQSILCVGDKLFDSLRFLGVIIKDEKPLQVILLDEEQFSNLQNHVVENSFEWISSVSSFNPIFENFEDWSAELYRSESNFLEENATSEKDLSRITFGVLSCLAKFSKKEIRRCFASAKAATESNGISTKEDDIKTNSTEDKTMESTTKDSTVEVSAKDPKINVDKSDSVDEVIIMTPVCKITTPMAPKSIEDDFSTFDRLLSKGSKLSSSKDLDLDLILNGPRIRQKPKELRNDDSTDADITRANNNKKAKVITEAEAKKKEEQEDSKARKKADAEAKKADAEAKKKADAEAKKKADAEAKKKADAEAKKADAEAKKKADAEAKKKADAEAKTNSEDENKKKTKVGNQSISIEELIAQLAYEKQQRALLASENSELKTTIRIAAATPVAKNTVNLIAINDKDNDSPPNTGPTNKKLYSEQQKQSLHKGEDNHHAFERGTDGMRYQDPSGRQSDSYSYYNRDQRIDEYQLHGDTKRRHNSGTHSHNHDPHDFREPPIDNDDYNRQNSQSRSRQQDYACDYRGDFPLGDQSDRKRGPHYSGGSDITQYQNRQVSRQDGRNRRQDEYHQYRSPSHPFHEDYGERAYNTPHDNLVGDPRYFPSLSRPPKPNIIIGNQSVNFSASDFRNMQNGYFN